MRQTKCSSCSTESALRSCYLINGQTYCGPCADKTILELKATNAPIHSTHAIDRTVCYGCNADGGSTEFQTIKNTPFCPACYQKACNRPFPGWLKAGMAVFLALLVFALVRGIPYFSANRDLYRGERLVASGNYLEAIPLLQTAVKNEPACDKCSLLLGKALLKLGDAPSAIKVLQAHNNGRFESSLDILKEVNGIMDRANKARDKADEADKAYKAKDTARALQLLRDAAALYPENQGFAAVATQMEIEIAYQGKDYDRLAELAKEQMQRFPQDPMVIGGYASALACKYAVTGDESFRAQSEQELQKANSLANTPELKKALTEYDKRIRHRLQTRLIIDKAEYDRRFRQAPTKPEMQQ